MHWRTQIRIGAHPCTNVSAAQKRVQRVMGRLRSLMEEVERPNDAFVWSLYEEAYQAQDLVVHHFDRYYDMCGEIQERFNDWCMAAGVPVCPLIDEGAFALVIADLLEATAYWGVEFWEGPIMSPMQAKVRHIAENRLFTRIRFGLKKPLDAWLPAMVQTDRPITGDPGPTITIPPGKIIKNIQPGGNVLIDGHLSVRFNYAGTEYYANVVEVAEAVGVSLPRGFKANDPWADKPLGQKREELWRDTLQAVSILERLEDEAFIPERQLQVIYRAGSPLVTLPPNERLRVFRNAWTSGPIYTFSHIVPYIRPPEKPRRVNIKNMPMKTALYMGIQKFSDIAYDVRDIDDAVAAASLFELMDILEPGRYNISY